MDRTDKIKAIKQVMNGTMTREQLLLKDQLPMPSWWWKGKTKEDLETDLKKKYGPNLTVVWANERPYLINRNPQKPNSQKPISWFKDYEKMHH